MISESAKASSCLATSQMSRAGCRMPICLCCPRDPSHCRMSCSRQWPHSAPSLHSNILAGHTKFSLRSACRSGGSHRSHPGKTSGFCVRQLPHGLDSSNSTTGSGSLLSTSSCFVNSPGVPRQFPQQRRNLPVQSFDGGSRQFRIPDALDEPSLANR